jgi:hypothetical protein
MKENNRKGNERKEKQEAMVNKTVKIKEAKVQNKEEKRNKL